MQQQAVLQIKRCHTKGVKLLNAFTYRFNLIQLNVITAQALLDLL
ncbi:Uncharacterised protein [Vibrio cholerae]|nr:Uncharacterised protein [Vibrio cholerae]CSI44034.1 Uncharacterised protein [Vibrio cholerae]CSI73869.1 Uncharacterised protein [Vibrio cholerae]